MNLSAVNETEAIMTISQCLSTIGYNVSVEQLTAVVQTTRAMSSSASSMAGTYDEFFEDWTDFDNGVRNLENNYNTLVNSWNGSFKASLVITSLIAVSSLLWPLIVAVNTRRNLRTGAWRYNRRAYLKSYDVHRLAEVPGMMVGTVIVSFVVILILIAFTVFCFAYTDLRLYLSSMWFSFIVATLIAMAFQSSVKFLVFKKLLMDKDGRIIDMNKFSWGFCVLMYFNLLYGTLSAIIRLCYFICYTLLGILRVDASVLPKPFRLFDSSFYSYNGYMLFEVRVSQCHHVHRIFVFGSLYSIAM